MAKRYREPTSYRDRKCPWCGFYFTARGLAGHLRFKHSIQLSEDTYKEVMQIKAHEIINKRGYHLTEKERQDLLDLFLLKQLLDGKL